MELTFLEADVYLSKAFTPTSKSSYPHAYEFTSHTHSISSIEEMHSLTVRHASLGHCLLKGHINKALKEESRAGSTDSYTYTELVCLDIDGLKVAATDAKAAVQEIVRKLGIDNVDHLVQLSSSQLTLDTSTINAHIFLMCESISPGQLKLWLKQLNLDLYKDDLALTKSKSALRWGLDITTCQNDKLLYIAPPVCKPPELDQIPPTDRIYLIKKEKRRITSPPLLDSAQIQQREIEHINYLRKAEGLPKRKFQQKEANGQRYLPNPSECEVTGVKTERGFTYLNLNGGDSWGYFHPDDNYEFVSNFKGEPTYKTSELLPEYYRLAKQATQKLVRSQHQTKLFLAFRDFETGMYYNGYVDQTDPQAPELTIAPAKSERQIHDFLLNYGQPLPDAIPLWKVEFDPTKNYVVDLNTHSLNMFKKSTYMIKTDPTVNKPPSNPIPTPVINKLLLHAIGSSELVEYFINWISFCYQYRTAPTTAWIWHGVQGTGKGLIFSRILRPLFGDANVVQKRMTELEDRFNEHLANSLIVNIDEAHISNSGKSGMIMADLKNQITEPKITIRKMRQAAQTVDNRAGFLFFSNMSTPVEVERTDRRFNVGLFQQEPLNITPQEVDHIQNELLSFAYQLQHHPVDITNVRTPILNDAKREIIEGSLHAAESISQALQKGNLEELWDNLPIDHINPSKASHIGYSGIIPTQKYIDLVYDLVRTRRSALHRDELYILFEYNVGKVKPEPKRFSKYLSHVGIKLAMKKTPTIAGARKSYRGFTVGPTDSKGWQQSDEWFDDRLTELNNADHIRRTGQPLLKTVPVHPEIEETLNSDDN